MSTFKGDDVKKGSDNLWLKYFGEGHTPPDDSSNYFNVLIIGQSKSGKSSILRFLRKNMEEAAIPEPMLHYTFIDIESIGENQEISTLNIWALDALPNLESLIEVAITPTVLHDGKCIILLLLNLSHPHLILPFLSQWIESIQRRIAYIDSNNITTSAVTSTIPSIIVVGSHSDTIDQVFGACTHPLSTCLTFQYQLRSWALKYNACLIFVSLKSGSNMEVFKSYLCHRAFGTHFNATANETYHESLFIPFGYDSDMKLNELKTKIKEIDPSEPISTYFDTLIMNQPDTYKRPKYVCVSDEIMKKSVEEILEGFEKNKSEQGLNIQNVDIINAKIVNEKLKEIYKLNTPSLPELRPFCDDRIQML